MGLLDISSSQDRARHGTTSGGVSNQRQKNWLIFFFFFFVLYVVCFCESNGGQIFLLLFDKVVEKKLEL